MWPEVSDYKKNDKGDICWYENSPITIIMFKLENGSYAGFAEIHKEPNIYIKKAYSRGTNPQQVIDMLYNDVQFLATIDRVVLLTKDHIII